MSKAIMNRIRRAIALLGIAPLNWEGLSAAELCRSLRAACIGAADTAHAPCTAEGLNLSPPSPQPSRRAGEGGSSPRPSGERGRGEGPAVLTTSIVQIGFMERSKAAKQSRFYCRKVRDCLVAKYAARNEKEHTFTYRSPQQRCMNVYKVCCAGMSVLSAS